MSDEPKKFPPIVILPRGVTAEQYDRRRADARRGVQITLWIFGLLTALLWYIWLFT